MHKRALSRIVLTPALVLGLALPSVTILAESGVQTVSYTRTPSPIDESSASTMIKAYYDNHGSWAGIYSMEKIKSIRLERQGNSRVIAHVEYVYRAKTQSTKHKNGVDRRTFVIIRHREWSVVGMGRHMSGSL